MEGVALDQHQTVIVKVAVRIKLIIRLDSQPKGKTHLAQAFDTSKDKILSRLLATNMTDL